MKAHVKWRVPAGLLLFLLLALVVGVMAQETAVSSPNQPNLIAGTAPLPDAARQLSLSPVPNAAATARDVRLDAALAELLAAAERSPQAALDLAEAGDLRVSGERVQMQLVTRPDALVDALAAVTAAGGEVTGVGAGDTLIQGWIRPEALGALADAAAIDYVRVPPRLVLLEETDVTAVTQGLAALNGPAWHSAGHRGAGIKIGIIDGGFTGYATLLGTNLPNSVTVRNFVDGEGSGQVGTTTPHGTACAEIVHDIAPDAQLYLVKISTNIDLEEAVNYLIAQGVDVISTSLGWYGLTPGDGTGQFAQLASLARDNGILWATAAGNDREAHWGGLFSDPGGNGYHDFGYVNGDNPIQVNHFGPTPEEAYLINPGNFLQVFARWDDWTNVNQDYALLLLRWNKDLERWEIIDDSDNPQTGQQGQRPAEYAQALTFGESTFYGYMIQRINSNRSVALEIHAPQLPRTAFIVPARSLVNLADVAHAVTVAALDAGAGFAPQFYSAEGPTNGPGGTLNGGAIKPDLAGYTNVSTESYGPSGFGGTSGATPHVAGAAALVMSAYPGYSVQQVRDFLQARAVDIGTPGRDTRFGYGRLYLGSPPAPVVLDEFAYVPLVLANHTGTVPARANFEITNNTGGNLRIELRGYDTREFGPGVWLWTDIVPASYDVRITSLSGPCAGSVLERQYTLQAGKTLRVTYTCNTGTRLPLRDVPALDGR